MYYDYSYALEEAMSGLGFSLIANMGSSVMSILIYVFTALSLYTIAKRREISKPWLAWIPVANCWILGSIADQYRYVARGETKNKRKTLLILNIVSCVLSIAALVWLGGIAVNLFQNMGMYNMMDEEEKIQLMKSLGGVIGLTLPLSGISIAYLIIYYMALYDVYASCDPNNKTVYLVVSIFFSLVQAIFLFLCRDKDGGMPPRRELPGAGNYYGGQNTYGQNPYYGQNQYYGQNSYNQNQYYGGQYQQPQYQQPQYQQPQYQQPQYQQPQYQPPQQAEPVRRTEELPQQDAAASPYSQWPDPYAPQHPEKNEDAPEQL